MGHCRVFQSQMGCHKTMRAETRTFFVPSGKRLVLSQLVAPELDPSQSFAKQQHQYGSDAGAIDLGISKGGLFLELWHSTGQEA